MKKKMGILGGLVMAAVVTGYSVAGTYAKYISAFDMADEARVAKWSFNDTATREVDLFQSSYTYGDNGIVVASKDADKVVAPGTEGEYVYNIEGTAETNYKVTTNVKIINRIALVADYRKDYNPAEPWDDGNAETYYNPIEFSFDGGATWVKAETPVVENGKFVGFSLEGNVVDGTVYPANYELTGDTAVKGSIKWRWTFSTSDENDVLDTVLAHNVENWNLNMTANVGVVVEQTQDAPTYVEGATTKAPVVFTSGIASEANEAADVFGYVAANSKDVVFNGRKLSGTIKATTNAYTERYMGKAATGYYYPLTIKADVTEVTGITIKDTWATEDHDSVYSVEKGNWNGELSLIIGLKKNTDKKEIIVTYADGTTEEVSIDLTELVFE